MLYNLHTLDCRHFLQTSCRYRTSKQMFLPCWLQKFYFPFSSTLYWNLWLILWLWYCHALSDYRRGLDWQLDLLESNTDTLNYNCVPPDSFSLTVDNWVSQNYSWLAAESLWRPSRLATTLTCMASLAFTKLLSLGLLELLSLLCSRNACSLHCPRYMTFGRTVEKTLLLALLVV
jgi:hypothetical protein